VKSRFVLSEFGKRNSSVPEAEKSGQSRHGVSKKKAEEFSLRSKRIKNEEPEDAKVRATGDGNAERRRLGFLTKKEGQVQLKNRRKDVQASDLL